MQIIIKKVQITVSLLFQVHKETIDGIPNAIPGRTDIELEIYGMEGIPEKDIGERRRVLEQKNQGSRIKCSLLLCSVLENYYACLYFKKLKRKRQTRRILMRMMNLDLPSSPRQAMPPVQPSLLCLLALVLQGYQQAATQVGNHDATLCNNYIRIYHL